MLTSRDTGAPVVERTNEQWLAALRGPQRDEALADLRAVLVRGLRPALKPRAGRNPEGLPSKISPRRLKKRLAAEGLSPQEVLAALSEE